MFIVVAPCLCSSAFVVFGWRSDVGVKTIHFRLSFHVGSAAYCSLALLLISCARLGYLYQEVGENDRIVETENILRNYEMEWKE